MNRFLDELTDSDSARLIAVLERSRDLGFLGRGPVEAHVEHSRRFLFDGLKANSRCLDLGSGGGVPGLILAMVLPCSWTLLDAMVKRCEFLRESTVELGIDTRVNVVEGRAEEVGRNRAFRYGFDLVTARSFGSPAVTAECASPLLTADGVLVVSEPPDAVDRWDVNGLAELHMERLASSREVAVIRQIEVCGERFPRRTGVPAKRPLW